jgi:plastocyanin
MRVRRFLVLATLAAFAAGAGAENISGTITIKRHLTHRSVTPAIPVYQRGTTVKLGKDADQDPIGYELARVVIYIEGAELSGASSAPTAPVRVAQVDRRFSPDLVIVPAGSSVSFPNIDPIFHNVFSLSKPKSFDLGSYDKGDTRVVTFPKPGIVDVYCHLHPNMQATVVVTPNRWYAQPGPAGEYKLPDLPPGRYTIVAWHKSAGFFRKTIEVEAGQNAVANFFIPLKEDAERAAIN